MFGYSANDRRRDPRTLAHHEFCGRRQFVDDRNLGHRKLTSEGVGAAAQIEDRPDAGAADRNIGDPAAPWSTKRVADDDCDFDVKFGPYDIANPPC